MQGPAAYAVAQLDAERLSLIHISRPVRKYWGGIRYFDLYGDVALAYDVGREVLQLSDAR